MIFSFSEKNNTIQIELCKDRQFSQLNKRTEKKALRIRYDQKNKRALKCAHLFEKTLILSSGAYETRTRHLLTASQTL